MFPKRISRRLYMNRITDFILIPNPTKNIEPQLITNFVTHLRGLNCNIGVFSEHMKSLSYLDDKIHEIKDNNLLARYNAAIVLGGDGSIIEASNKLLDVKIPIIGINFGHVGYLAEIEINELDLLDALVEGSYGIDERMMLDAEIVTEHGDIRVGYTVLNDIVLSNGPVARLLTFDIFCGDVKIQTCRADGIIAATPTGSTAYSLSAGGPVLEPSLDCLCLTPICPHTLNSRPIILRGDKEIRISNIRSNGSSVYATADGRDVITLDSGDTISIKRSAHTTRLIRIKDNGFVGILHSKLSEQQ